MLLLLSLLFQMKSQAQIFTTSQDPARVRWSQIRTAGYKFIYPEGYDSLAVSYAKMFERFRKPVSATSGFLPARVPVVLHPLNAAGEYSLSELPSVINMSLLPQGKYSFSYPVSELAAVSLSRQAAHMNFASSHVFKPFTWIFGELFPFAIEMLYPDKWLLSGDAAIAATALIPEGYGRYGEFLNYYMAAFDAGDMRGYKWDRWAIGSYNRNTPGTDAFGYMILSGLRCMYDKPDYVADYLSHTSRRPYDIFYGSSLSKRTSGGNLHTSSFRKIFDWHRDIYTAELSRRMPFTDAENVLQKENSSYTEYSCTAAVPDGTIFSVRKSLDRSPRLVRISPDGKERTISPFSGTGSRMVWSEPLGRLYWSETVNDWRWAQSRSNIVRYYEPESGKTRTLAEGINIFNPCISPDGMKIAAIYGPEPDKTTVMVLDAMSGYGLGILPYPEDGVLLTGCAWCGDGLFASGVSDEGSWIFRAETDGKTGYMGWKAVAGPSRCSIRNLDSHGNHLVFSCDASGVFDLYQLEESGIYKLTSSKYGAKDFVFSHTGEKLYFSGLDHLGYDLHVADADSLFHIETNLDSIRKSEAAQELIRQEKEAVANTGPADMDISAPERYRKGLNLFRLHSWAPVYCNISRLDDMNGEKLYDYVSLGATVLSQNTLGSAYGSAGWCWKPDPDGSGWVHGGHVNFTYAGWYPVIEAGFYINDRLPWNYTVTDDGQVIRSPHQGPSLAGRLDLYVPLTRETGGMSINFLPRISWEIDNSRYNGLLNHSTTVSGRFWMLRDMAKADIFPRYGIGLETGIRMAYAAGSRKYQPIKLGDTWFFHAYGYFPGAWKSQGGKISATTQKVLNQGVFNPGTEILPRGFTGTVPKNLFSPTFSALLTLDYAVPVYLGDINITPLIYLNRMIVTPHFDYGYSSDPELHLCSAGASLTFQLGRLLWSFPLEIGADYSYNFGTIFSMMKENGSRVIRNVISPVIKISF